MLRALPILVLLAAAACDPPSPPPAMTPPVGMPPLGEPPAHVVGGFTISLPATELAPGDERHPCWILPLAPTGPSRLVGGAVPRTTPGLHHLPNNHPTHIVTALPHMHQLGTALQATYLGGPFDGTAFLDSTGYDPEDGVLVQYEPAVDLIDAEGITFSCSWQNTFDKTIVEGVGDNEMCMVFGYAWPFDKAYSAIASPDNCLMFATPPPAA